MGRCGGCRQPVAQDIECVHTQAHPNSHTPLHAILKNSSLPFRSMGECPVSIVTALINHGSRDIYLQRQSRSKPASRTPIMDLRKDRYLKNEKRKGERERRRKHGLTLLMEYVVVEERALPVGAPACATILDSRAPAPAPTPAPMLPQDSIVPVWPNKK